jgi:hypothetical protein
MDALVEKSIFVRISRDRSHSTYWALVGVYEGGVYSDRDASASKALALAVAELAKAAKIA